MEAAKLIRIFFAFVLVFHSVIGVGAALFRPLSQPPSAFLEQLAGPLRGAHQKLESLSFPQIAAERLANGKAHLALPGATSLLVEGMPEVPFVTRRMELPPGYSGKAVLASARFEESVASLDLALVEEAFVWADESNEMKLGPPPVGRYFPGKLVESHEEEGKLSVTLFPVQYDRWTRKLIVLREADLEASLERQAAGETPRPRRWTSEALILTTEKMKEGATLLRKFQEGLGVTSEVVTVEQLAKTETPIDEALLPDGYKSRASAERAVLPFNAATGAGYNYELARKIIHHLQRRVGDGPLHYVTILGSGDSVPPSYYFSIPSGSGAKFGATDQCYSSVSFCREPKLAVGRLPFDSIDQVKNYLAKAARWLSFAPRAPSELAVFGGKAFPVTTYIGELGTLQVVNQPGAGWRGLKKFYRTKGSYTRANVLDLVAGKMDSSFVYYLDHGKGNLWRIDREGIATNDLSRISEPGPGVSPVIVSISCSDAAFDETLVKEPLFSDPEYGTQSVGVALLKSKAGAVAYLGSTRPALGWPAYTVDKYGNLNLSGSNYSLELLSQFFAKYQEAGGGRLGDLVLRAQKAYVSELGNDMRNSRNVWTHLIFELLGDPVLRVPDRKDLEKEFAMAKSSTKFDVPRPSPFPGFFATGGEAAPTLAFTAGAEVMAELVKIVRGGSDPLEDIITEKSFAAGAGELPVNVRAADLPGQYFLRLENQEGVPVERQVWFTIAPK